MYHDPCVGQSKDLFMQSKVQTEAVGLHIIIMKCTIRKQWICLMIDDAACTPLR